MKTTAPDLGCFGGAIGAKRLKPKEKEQRLFIMLDDWTWWAWFITAVLLTVGLLGFPVGFGAACGVTVLQTIIMLIRERSFTAFPVQLRLAYGFLLGVCFLPSMQWLFWLPTVGTYALTIFGYCLLARVLSLLPWNRTEVLSLDVLLRTFMSRPSLARLATHDQPASGCAGGLCTIDAQVQRNAMNATKLAGIC